MIDLILFVTQFRDICIGSFISMLSRSVHIELQCLGDEIGLQTAHHSISKSFYIVSYASLHI